MIAQQGTIIAQQVGASMVQASAPTMCDCNAGQIIQLNAAYMQTLHHVQLILVQSGCVITDGVVHQP